MCHVADDQVGHDGSDVPGVVPQGGGWCKPDGQEVSSRSEASMYLAQRVGDVEVMSDRDQRHQVEVLATVRPIAVSDGDVRQAGASASRFGPHGLVDIFADDAVELWCKRRVEPTRPQPTSSATEHVCGRLAGTQPWK
jgi:hypothetical protein